MFEDAVTALKAHYDKLIAFVMLVCLIGSLLYLAVQIGRIQQKQREWDAELRGVKPTHPDAEVQDESAFQQAQKAIAEPLQLDYNTWTNRQLTIPEMRVWCVDCRWPIPFSATNCPSCGRAQPKEDIRDTDQDGMRDDWEKKYGLNPQDRSDADKDKDGDGFTNKEEFDAGTDPTDPKSRPELPYKLRVERIDVKSFLLKFRSTIITPDSFRSYGLNRIQAGSTQTFFRKIGQEVSGFKLVKFEEKSEMRTSATSKIPQRFDVSELTLVLGDKVIVLVKGKDEEQFEYTVHLIFLVNKKRITGTQNDIFMLQDERYKILRIDRDSESVVIQREQDGKQFTVRKLTK